MERVMAHRSSPSSSAHAVVRHLVRVTAVTALLNSGAAEAAEVLRAKHAPTEPASLDDDQLPTLEHDVRQATERVLQAPPPDPEDRALLIVLAARAAVALAAVADPEPRHTAALFEHIKLVMDLGGVRDG
jgi:hypothetical protein